MILINQIDGHFVAGPAGPLYDQSPYWFFAKARTGGISLVMAGTQLGGILQAMMRARWAMRRLRAMTSTRNADAQVTINHGSQDLLRIFSAAPGVFIDHGSGLVTTLFDGVHLERQTLDALLQLAGATARGMGPGSIPLLRTTQDDWLFSCRNSQSWAVPAAFHLAHDLQSLITAADFMASVPSPFFS